MKLTQKGRSMVEMLGVLAIVGVLSVAGIAGYSMAMNKYRQTRIMDNIQLISTNVRTLFSTQANYGTAEDITLNMIKLGVLTRDLCPDATNASTCRNAYGGTIRVIIPSDSTMFQLQFTMIPRSACVSLAMTDWGGVENGFLGTAYVAHTANDPNAAVTAPADPPNKTVLNLGTAVTACADPSYNAVTFYFR